MWTDVRNVCDYPHVTIPVLFAHDAGCRYARESDGGHSDAAKRLSDAYNLHKMCGESWGWIAIHLDDGSTDSTVYPTRSDAVSHQHHNEANRGYLELRAPWMSVCEAAAYLRWLRQAAKAAKPDRDELGGGLAVVPRLTWDGIERQITAMETGNGYVAYGRKR